MEQKSIPTKYKTRPERFVPIKSLEIKIFLKQGKKAIGTLLLKTISKGGLQGYLIDEGKPMPVLKQTYAVTASIGNEEYPLCDGILVRLDATSEFEEKPEVALVLNENEVPAVELLKQYLRPIGYVSLDLRDDLLEEMTTSINGLKYSLSDFYKIDSPDLLEKTVKFYEMIKYLQKNKFYQGLYRVTLTSGHDHQITVFNPMKRTEEPMVCYDSNSYLCLHKHPRVVKATQKALRECGYGTPSSQLLSGTSKYLRELEETVAEFHGRKETIIFPSGYTANIGIITGLVRENDLIVRDRFAHNSIRAGVIATDTHYSMIYNHHDYDELESILKDASGNPDIQGKLIVTDAVFSMHGSIANLPRMKELSVKYNACLMLDEAHSIGVLGKTGGGIEEHFSMPGSIDVVMGTFSKVPGGLGGYATGSSEMITYLRHFAHAAMFSTALPSHICAGVNEAFHVIKTEPEHQIKLVHNVKTLSKMLKEAGFIVSPPGSSILTVLIGPLMLLWIFSRELFDNGIKAGSVTHPAVAKGESIIRLSLMSTHTPEDLEFTVDTFKKIGKKLNICGKSPEELMEMADLYKM